MENRRTADAARLNGDLGDLPKHTAAAIHERGNAGILEAGDLLSQVHQRDPAQARELHNLMMEWLPPETLGRATELAGNAKVGSA